ncbi:MAG: hypothetical protein E8D48_04480 [Nitrospira sp.]|nr:MAG: hypothetical protein E8D48_04480 [Nitrospira sp.]
MDTIQYKGFEIQAAPYQLDDSGEWQVNLHIFRHREHESRSRKFSAGSSYKTREEAMANCFQFGKQIIDGQLPTCTVADM